MIQFYAAFSKLLYISLFIFLLTSCSKFDKEEPIPSYISIPTIEFIVPDSLKEQQGSASSKIADSWVYIDDVLQGIYELPAQFPVLIEGEHTLKVFPGIKQNGIGSTRPIYPFYTEFVETITLTKAKVVVSKPKTYYRSYTKFVWKENFEGVSISLIKASTSDTNFIISTNPADVFEGQKSLVAYMDETHKLFECKSTTAFVLNTNGTPVFLEFNYKTNSPLSVGFLANSSVLSLAQPVITLNPTISESGGLFWNKIYINLTDFLGDYYQSDNFTLVFSAEKPTDIALSEVYLDNIKLVQ